MGTSGQKSRNSSIQAMRSCVEAVLSRYWTHVRPLLIDDNKTYGVPCEDRSVTSIRAGKSSFNCVR